MKKLVATFQSHTTLYLMSILILAIVMRLIALNQSFWLDEAAQATISLKPFTPGHFNGDFQPPLSYYLTHVWMNFGNMFNIRSEWFLRLPMVGFGVATVFLLFLLVKDLVNKRSGLLAGLILAVAPFHIYYSQEMRMYSMLTFFSVLSWYLVYHRRWKWLIISTAIGIFTHYFFFVHLAAQAVYIILMKKDDVQKFFISATLGTAPFIFWIPTFFRQLQTSQKLIADWPGWQNISNTGFVRFPGLVIAKFSVGMISPEPRWLYGAVVGAVSLVALLSAGALLWSYMKHKKIRNSIAFLGAMFVVPLMIAWIGGIFISASSPWRIQFVLPAFYALIAVAVTQSASLVPKKWSWIGILVVGFLLFQNIIFSSQYLLNADNHRENWRGAIAYTDNIVAEEGIVLAEYTGLWAPMIWYTEYPDSYSGASTQQHMTPESVAHKLATVIYENDTVVLYTYLFEISDPERLVEQYLQNNEYTLVSEKDFRGVGIVKTFLRSSKQYALSF